MKETKSRARFNNLGEMWGHGQTDKSDPDNTPDKRGKVLTEAIEIINGGRQDSHGNPEDSFRVIAQYWSIYLNNAQIVRESGDIELDALDVADMMVLLKQARKLGQELCVDNYRDAAGYEGIGGDLVLKQQAELGK